jgi:hypothetical protein
MSIKRWTDFALEKHSYEAVGLETTTIEADACFGVFGQCLSCPKRYPNHYLLQSFYSLV